MSPEQEQQLNAIVPDGRKWYDNAMAIFGRDKAEEFLLRKLANPLHQETLKQHRKDGKTRAMRDADEEAQRIAKEVENGN